MKFRRLNPKPVYANDASVVTSTTRGLRCEDTLCDRVIHVGG